MPSPDSSIVIYNGVAMPSPERRRGRVIRSPIRVLYAGRFDPQKGTDLLPEIIKRVRLPSGYGAVLELYGSGPHERLLKDFAATPPQGWTISVNPPVADLRRQLDRFDMVLMPSRFEGLGLVAVEALMAGRPVVVTHIPGLSEVVPEDYPLKASPESAVSFADVVSRFIQEPQKYSQDIDRARNFADQRFNPTDMCRGYTDLYRSALVTEWARPHPMRRIDSVPASGKSYQPR